MLSLHPGFLLGEAAGAALTACAGLTLFPSTTTHLLHFPHSQHIPAQRNVCPGQQLEARDTLSSPLLLSLPAQGFVNPLPTPALSWITALSLLQKYVLCPHCIKHWLPSEFLSQAELIKGLKPARFHLTNGWKEAISPLLVFAVIDQGGLGSS